VKGRVPSAEQYPWLLTADPPVCRVGTALAVLRRCERLGRDERCICRFQAADIADDLIAGGRPDLAEYFETALEPEDVEELAEKLSQIELGPPMDAGLADRLTLVRADLRRLVRHGSGLTDTHSDDLD
jgi:hypothetical protein